MAGFSQVIAGDGVEHAGAEEGGADQQIDDVVAAVQRADIADAI
jgi:hypothetical protein